MGVLSGTIWIARCQRSCIVNVTLNDIPHSVPLGYRLVANFERFELTERLRTVPFQHFVTPIRNSKALYGDILL